MKRKGFTLIELLAVILILGIIALIAIPIVTRLIRQARLGAWEATGNHMIKAAETFFQAEQLKVTDPTGAMILVSKKYTAAQRFTDIDTLKSTVDIKGRIPEFKDIIVYDLNDDGEVLLEFKVGTQFVCGNSIRMITQYNDVNHVEITSMGRDAEVKCMKYSDAISGTTNNINLDVNNVADTGVIVPTP